MGSLIDGVERALLGVLLCDHVRVPEAAHLDPADFGTAAHGRIFQALRDVAGTLPAAIGINAVMHLVAAATGDPAIPADRLLALALTAPEPRFTAVYARMVHEAATLAALAAHAERDPAYGPGPDGGSTPSDAAAVHRRALGYALAAHVAALHRPPPDPYAMTAADPAALTAAGRREQEILAELLQDRDRIHDVRSWLAAEAFAPGPHRDVYAAMAAVADRGEPVTDLVLAWELARRHTFRPHRTAPAPAAAAAAPPAAAHPAVRICARVEPGTAARLGRQLVEENARAPLAAAVAAINARPRMRAWYPSDPRGPAAKPARRTARGDVP
ncbi:DnaB-like helicase N-terminal domain-containing protein [Yinghuangia soli]|uniref:DNA helicase DnaB-like N-terminal domain-containing protein n=1 Tax=Yinghuangia soli TaxID=2908204 RepID=A0AA41Q7Z6_9ACTN|nr:DnaB-like helicase N-terminal domain-containing protein [Yinghuangia soli]MCF2532416.1 hypothetical protein [Yinghuangia soli]